MAIIGKIHDKGRYILVGIIGLALLTFIFTSFFDTLGANADNGGIGTIDGETVDYNLFLSAEQRTQMTDAMNYQQQGREYTDRDKDQSSDKAWNFLVDSILLSKEYAALGIDVSDKELNAYLYGTDGFPLLPEIQQAFADSLTGRFNPAKLDKFIAERENAKEAEVINQWKSTKEGLRMQRQQEKYFQLMGQAIYVTELEAKDEYMAREEKKSISFVARSYREMDDEDVKITDAEIRKFYEEHKNEKKYEMLAGRDVKYFDVTIAPSEKDITEFNKEFEKLKKEFAAKTSAKEDSMFVLLNSETKVFSTMVASRPQNDAKARPPFTYPAAMDSVFKGASVGQVVGPYMDNGKSRLAKVLSFNDKLCKVRHILISAPKGDDAKIASSKKLADSLVKIVNKDNFESMVMTYSEDPGSKNSGGVYEDFFPNDMVKPFADFSAEKPIGTIGVVQTDFGFHIIEVLDRKAVKYPVLAFVEKTLIPSSETEMEIRDNVTDLLYKIDSKVSAKKTVMEKLNIFDTIARKEGYFVRPVRMMEESPRATGFNTKLAEQKILALAFEEGAEPGTLCSAPINDKGRYIIAMVSSIRKEDGAPSFEDAYQKMRDDAIKDKKAKKFIAQFGSERNLDKLAQKFHTQVNAAEVTFASPSIQGGGYEPEIVGALYSGLKDGQTTKPLKGNAGVYVIRIDRTVKPAAASNFKEESKRMVAQQRGSLQSTLRTAMQKTAKVYDNRALNAAGVTR